MMVRISEMLEKTTSSSAELAEAVSKRGRVTIDADKVNAHFAGQLDQRLQLALAPSVARVEAVLAEFERKVAVIGAERSATASREVEAVVSKADDVVRAVRAAESRVEALSARVTWTAVGRMALALLPLAVVLLLVGGLTMGAAHAFGVGPLLGWAWDSFAAAGVWWAKALIAAGVLSGVTAFVWLCWRIARVLGEEYGRW